MSIKLKWFDLMTNETARKLALLTKKCWKINDDDDDDDEKYENISSEVFTSVMSINYLFIYLFYPRFEQPGPDFLSFFFFFFTRAIRWPERSIAPIKWRLINHYTSHYTRWLFNSQSREIQNSKSISLFGKRLNVFLQKFSLTSKV